jgi:hypothetical protein
MGRHILYFKVRRSLNFIWQILNRLGPTCQWPISSFIGQPGYLDPHLPAIWSVTTGDRAHHAVEARVPITAGDHRPMWAGAYPVARGHSGESSSIFASKLTRLPLCSRLCSVPHCAAPLLPRAVTDEPRPAADKAVRVRCVSINLSLIL